LGQDIVRDSKEVLIKDDLRGFLAKRYKSDKITDSEIDSIIRRLELLSASDLYESNKANRKLLDWPVYHPACPRFCSIPATGLHS
jgi:type I restriction enzyme R subunit